MDILHLVQMANRIAEFFDAMPADDPDGGTAGVLLHLRRYWTPAMRRELCAAAAAGTLTGVHPLLERALRDGQQQLA
jgi:formate dehydrogenase subunit delta